MRFYFLSAWLSYTSSIPAEAVPDAYEGPLLLQLSAGHAIKLVDAIGLAFIFLATVLSVKALRS